VKKEQRGKKKEERRKKKEEIILCIDITEYHHFHIKKENTFPSI